MFWNRKRTTIHVEFIDAADMKVFARTDLPPERLPDSFEAETTMHLGEVDWRVVSAIPSSAAEFGKSGRLRLVMSRIETATVDPRDLLFSLPTIAAELPTPDAANSKLGKRVLELHEDDWRQVELYAAEHEALVSAHLAQVRSVHETARRGLGFTRLHIREGLGELLPRSGCTLSALRDQCPPEVEWLDGLSLREVAGLVPGGFAVRLPTSLVLYGTAPEDHLDVLGIYPAAGTHLRLSDLEPILAFVRTRKLRIVDWCRVAQLEPAS